MLIGGRLGNLVLNLVALAVVGLHLFYVARGLRSLAGIAVDFTNYYLAAQLVVTGEDFYVNLGHVGQRFGIADVWLPYTLTPIFAILFTPFTLLSHDAAKWAWNGLQVVFLVVALGLLISSFQVRWPIRQPGVFLFLVLLFPPLRDELNEAQVGLLLFVLVCGAWYCHVKGWDVGAGALVGVAAAIKLFPIVALVYFGWRRRYRTVVVALATVTVLTVIGIALTGVTPLVRYFGAVLPSLRNWYGHFNNQSLVGLFTRFLAEGPFTSPWADVPWLAFALSALAVSGIAVLTLLGWTRLAREPLDPPLAFSLALLAMLLMSPITWSHYLVFAYFPLLTLVASLERTRPFSWRRFDLALIVYVLLSVPSAIVVDPQTLDLPVVGLLAQTLASWGYEPGQRVGGLALVLSLGKVSGLLLAFGLTWSLLGPRRSPEHLPTGGDSLAAKGTRQA